MEMETSTCDATVRAPVRGRFPLKGKRRSFLLDIEKNPFNGSNVATKSSSDQLQYAQASVAAIMSLFWME
jgi:hypothetical protein